jgi:hypothetical protein
VTGFVVDGKHGCGLVGVVAAVDVADLDQAVTVWRISEGVISSKTMPSK